LIAERTIDLLRLMIAGVNPPVPQHLQSVVVDRVPDFHARRQSIGPRAKVLIEVLGQDRTTTGSMVQEKRLRHDSPLFFPIYTMAYSLRSQSLHFAFPAAQGTMLLKTWRWKEMFEVLSLIATFFAGTPSPSPMVQVFNLYVVLFVYCALLFPLVGGAVLWKGFQVAGIPDFTFLKCWKIYLAGLCYGYLVIIGLRFILEPAPAVPTILFFAVPLMAIPLLGRNFSQRVVIVEVLVVLLANSIMIGLLFTMPFFLGSSKATDHEGLLINSSSQSQP
jgi:hypothetical protein